MNSPVRLGVSPIAAIPTGFYRQRFEALFPCAGTLSCVVSLTPHLFLLVYLHANVGLPAPLAAGSPTPVLQTPPCHESSPPQLPVSAPPTGFNECFFLNSSVAELPYILIFWQFRLFFVFNLLLSFFWLCEEA